MSRDRQAAAALPALLELDRVVHEPARLVILTVLAGADEVEFAEGPIRQILFNLIQNAIDASPAGATVEVK